MTDANRLIEDDLTRIAAAIDAGPFFVRTPFAILVDQAEKHPWGFTDLKARSFIDKDMRTYLPRVESAYLGIGRGDYSIDGFQSRVGIERKSMPDFQSTLLGWEHDVDRGEYVLSVDRRARFKRELATLATLDLKAVVVEASLGECLANVPSWGVRSSIENAKYLAATYLAWSQQFAGVPWYFCEDRRMAEEVCFRLLEKWWAEEQKHAHPRRKRKKARPINGNMAVSSPLF